MTESNKTWLKASRAVKEVMNGNYSVAAAVLMKGAKRKPYTLSARVARFSGLLIERHGERGEEKLSHFLEFLEASTAEDT